MKIKIRRAEERDLLDLLRIDAEIWLEFPATEAMFRSRINVFPEGQLVAENLQDGRVFGSVFTQRIDYAEWKDKNFSWNEITDYGTIKATHQPLGQDLYGVGLAVEKRFQGSGAATKLMLGIARLILRNNIRDAYTGARMPRYSRHIDMTPQAYAFWTRDNHPIDPEIYLYFKAGFSVVRVLPNYIKDLKSLNYGALMVKRNPCGRLSGKFISLLGERALGKILGR